MSDISNQAVQWAILKRIENVLDQVTIKDAVISVERVNNTLIFTNQAKKEYSFDLQSLDIDTITSDVIKECKDYSTEQIKRLRELLTESLGSTTKDLLTNVSSIEQSLLKRLKSLDSSKDSLGEDIALIKKSFEQNYNKSQVDSLVAQTKESFVEIDSSLKQEIEDLKKVDESIVSDLNKFVEYINDLDLVEDVKFEGNYAYVTKNGKTKKYLLPVGRGGGGGGGGGGSTPEFKYTNTLPTPNKVGGVPKGTVFDAMLLSPLLSLLLYSYNEPYFATFNIDYKLLYEVGEPINHQLKNAYWGINDTNMLQTNSIEIKYINEDIVIASNLPNNGFYGFISPEIVFNIPTKVDFKISAMSTTLTTLIDYFTFYYKHRIYIGNNELELLDNDDIKSLQLTDLVDTIDGKYPIDEGGYKWICYPVFFGLKRNFKDFETDIDIEMEDVIVVNVTNIYNVDINYYCHRSFYKLGSSMEIIVS